MKNNTTACLLGALLAAFAASASTLPKGLYWDLNPPEDHVTHYTVWYSYDESYETNWTTNWLGGWETNSSFVKLADVPPEANYTNETGAHVAIYLKPGDPGQDWVLYSVSANNLALSSAPARPIRVGISTPGDVTVSGLRLTWPSSPRVDHVTNYVVYSSTNTGYLRAWPTQWTKHWYTNSEWVLYGVYQPAAGPTQSVLITNLQPGLRVWTVSARGEYSESWPARPAVVGVNAVSGFTVLQDTPPPIKTTTGNN